MAADKSSVPGWMWMDAERVVRVALAGAERGARVVVPGTRYKVLVAVSRVLPASLVAKGSLRAR
jgi:short-subunit dehydrogenase